MQRNCLVGALKTAIIWLMIGNFCQAQPINGPQDKPVTPLNSSVTFFPRPEESFKYGYKVGSEDRVLHYHLEDPSSGREGVFYVRPPFYPEKAATTIAGYPDIVHKREFGDDATVEITLKLRVFGKQIEDFSRDVLIANAREIYFPQGTKRIELNPTTIFVYKWPIEYLVLQLVVKDQVVATWRPDEIFTGIPEVVEPRFKLTYAQLELFKQYAENEPHQVKIRPFYSYQGRKTDFAIVELKAAYQAAQGLWFQLHSQQEEPTEVKSPVTIPLQDIKPDPKKGEKIEEKKWKIKPITQIDYSEVERQLNTAVYQTLRATNPNLLEFARPVGQELMARILDPSEEIEIADLTKQFPEFEQQLAAYLTPHLKTLELLEGVQESKVKSSSSGGGIFAKITIPIKAVAVGLGGHADWKSALEKSSGVQFRQSESEQTFEPHTIHSYKVRKSFDQKDFESMSVTFLSVELGAKAFRQDSDVPITATFQDFLSNYKKREAAMPYRNYVVGDVDISFSPLDRDPRFWAPADGQVKFPAEPSTPISLQGKPVPDLGGALIGGATNSAEVGMLWKNGVMTLPALPVENAVPVGTVTFKSFTLPGGTWTGLGLNSNRKFKPNNQPEHPVHGTAPISDVTALSGLTQGGLKATSTTGPHTFPKEVCEKEGIYPPHVRVRFWVLIRPLPVE